MKYILLTLIIYVHTLNAIETIHSSVSAYYENKSFSNSVQKLDGQTYGITADMHHNNSEYKFAYESGKTNTIQPPLPKDLHTDKLFLRYENALNNRVAINLNHINILHDNLAITDEGKAYGLGVTYTANKKAHINFTQFYTHYEDFNVHQSDVKIDMKVKLADLNIKFSSLTKYINIDETNVNAFTKNAKSNYLTSAMHVHTRYKSYHLGALAYLGKRAFAIMGDGFKIQHHAMEFDRTYAFTIGKNVSKDIIFRMQYIYQNATELPSSNPNVEIQNIRLLSTFKF